MSTDPPSASSHSLQTETAPSAPRSGRSKKRSALFVCAAAVVALLALELAARLVVSPPRATGGLVPDDLYGCRPADFDPRAAPAKRPGVKRILLLGDSFAAGAGASAPDKRFSDVMLRRLRQRDSRWEVVNAGVAGWGPETERLFLEREGRRLEPDVVLTAVCLGNDATDETGLTRIAVFHGAPILASRVDTPMGRAFSWMRLHCRLLHALAGAASNAPLLWARRAAQPPYPGVEWRSLMRRPPWLEGEFYAVTRANEPFYDAGLEALLNDLKGIGAASRSLRAQALFVLLPGRLQAVEPLRRYAFQLNGIPPAEEDPAKLNRRIVPFLEAQGLACLDLLALMQKRGSAAPALYHVDHDDHFNDAGHQFAGEALADWIERISASPSQSSR